MPTKATLLSLLSLSHYLGFLICSLSSLHSTVTLKTHHRMPVAERWIRRETGCEIAVEMVGCRESIERQWNVEREVF
jgi:hypothetical protein